MLFSCSAGISSPPEVRRCSSCSSKSSWTLRDRSCRTCLAPRYMIRPPRMADGMVSTRVVTRGPHESANMNEIRPPPVPPMKKM